MRKTLLLFLFMLFIAQSLFAQVIKEYSCFWPAIGIQAGSPGFGIEGSYPIADDFNIRLGVNAFPSTRVQVRNRGFQLRKSNILITGDWQPLYGKRAWFARKWFLSGGLAYFLNNTLERFVSSTKPEERRKIYEVNWAKFRPYLGTGLSNIRLSYHLNLSLNAGFYIATSKFEIKPEDDDFDSMAGLQNRYESFPYNLAPSLNAQVGIAYIFF